MTLFANTSTDLQNLIRATLAEAKPRVKVLRKLASEASIPNRSKLDRDGLKDKLKSFLDTHLVMVHIGDPAPSEASSTPTEAAQDATAEPVAASVDDAPSSTEEPQGTPSKASSKAAKAKAAKAEAKAAKAEARTKAAKARAQAAKATKTKTKTKAAKAKAAKAKAAKAKAETDVDAQVIFGDRYQPALEVAQAQDVVRLAQMESALVLGAGGVDIDAEAYRVFLIDAGKMNSANWRINMRKMGGDGIPGYKGGLALFIQYPAKGRGKAPLAEGWRLTADGEIWAAGERPEAARRTRQTLAQKRETKAAKAKVSKGKAQRARDILKPPSTPKAPKADPVDPAIEAARQAQAKAQAEADEKVRAEADAARVAANEELLGDIDDQGTDLDW